MKFSDMIKELKAGKKIKRECWFNKYWCCPSKCTVVLEHLTKHSNPNVLVRLDLEELEATDWEVVD